MDRSQDVPFELDAPVHLDVSALYARFQGMRMEFLVRSGSGTRFVPARILAPEGDTASRHRFVLVRTNGWNGGRLHCVEVASGCVLASFSEGDVDGARVRSAFDQRVSSATSQSVDDEVERTTGVSLLVDWPQPFVDLDVFVLTSAADVPGLTVGTVWWADQADERRRAASVVVETRRDLDRVVLDTIAGSVGSAGLDVPGGERSLYYAQIGSPRSRGQETTEDPFQGADW